MCKYLHYRLIVVLLLILNYSCAGGGMQNTTYLFEPKSFHSLELDRNDLDMSSSSQITDLAPDTSNFGFVEGVWLSLPDRIVVNTHSLNKLVWEDAKVPVCLSYQLKNINFQKMYSEHEVFLKDIVDGTIVSTFVDLDSYDNILSRTMHTVRDDVMTGGTLVYNITYFTGLPKYSAEYEIWVKMAGIESDHKRIKIDLKENGRLVTRPEN